MSQLMDLPSLRKRFDEYAGVSKGVIIPTNIIVMVVTR